MENDIASWKAIELEMSPVVLNWNWKYPCAVEVFRMERYVDVGINVCICVLLIVSS